MAKRVGRVNLARCRNERLIGWHGREGQVPRGTAGRCAAREPQAQEGASPGNGRSAEEGP